MNNIITDRLIIRRFLATDGQDLYEYLSDEEVVKFEPYGTFTEEEAEKEAGRRAENPSFFAVCLKETEKLIGNLYLEQGDFDTWELGYIFNRKYQGNGYATEGAKALLDYAFSNLGARRIIAMCSKENTRFWKLLERLRLRREGLFLQNIFFKKDLNGSPIWFDTYSYAVLRAEWGK